VLEAIDASGAVHWSFKPATVTGGSSTASVAGPHLLLAAGTAVTVVDRGGVVVGHGSGTADLRPDPTGTRWAWSTIDRAPSATEGSTAPADQWSGSVWVAGIGENPHRVQSWTEPAETIVEVFLWSDRGIVTAVVPGGCAPQETSTALLDPATGRSTPLEGGDRHVVDVHAGLVLGIRQPETLLVTGARTATLTERPVTQGEHLAAAAISPDGVHVFGSMTSMSGCGGVPEVRTVVLAPATQQATILRDVFAGDWYDDTHVVVHGASDDALRLVALDGTALGGVLTHGVLVGVLRG
jgi:hypothetical protein